MIILIGGEKGGTGKTTLTTNLAASFALEGKDILIVDTDKQGSASAWTASREQNDYHPRIPCIQKFGKGLPEQVRDLSSRYEYIIVDAGGRDSIELRAAMVVANKLLIPIQASQFDVWTLGNMDELVKQAKAFNSSLEANIIINRASTNPSVNEADEAKSIINDFDEIKLSSVMIRDRIAFRKAAKSGLSVIELQEKDPKAISEISSLYNEIMASSKELVEA